MVTPGSCPRCPALLERAHHGEPFACPLGHGAFVAEVDEPVVLGAETLGPLRSALERAGPGDRQCPACAGVMRAFPLAYAEPLAPGQRARPAALEVDGCTTCGGFWFDSGELERLARPARATQGRRQLLRSWRERLREFFADAAGGSDWG